MSIHEIILDCSGDDERIIKYMDMKVTIDDTSGGLNEYFTCIHIPTGYMSTMPHLSWAISECIDQVYKHEHYSR